MMKNEPLVSICIPAYNSEKWIKTTIESVLSQSWKNKEIIVVDDGSKDNTYRIAKAFESSIVKVITQPNSGACVARNKALSIAQGDFIQWLDSDDFLARDKIEKQINSSDKDPDSKILHSSAWGKFYFRLKKAKFNPDPLWNDLTPIDWFLYHIGEGHMVHPAAWLVSRKLSELAGGWNEKLKLNQDGEYFCRVVASSDFVKFHTDAKCFYRIGNLSSISKDRSQKAISSLSESNNLCIDHLLDLENSEKTRKASIKFLQRFIDKVHLGNQEILDRNKNRIIELGGKVKPTIETNKFIIVKKVFGVNSARIIKRLVWNSEITARKYWDKMLAVVFRDGV